MSGNSDSRWGVCCSVAFVWFATHFGGGFASGRQLVDFYVKYGWYAVFTPILSVGLIALVLWCAWQFAVRHGVYDYHSWSVRYFEPLGWLEPVFSMLIEAMYLIILLLATGVAFATGGTVLNHIFPDIPYHVGTVGLAVLILSLTIWGSGTVRKASTVMSLLIIAGMLVIYSSNLVANFPRLLQVMRELTEAEGGFWPALWQSVKYAALQCSLVGAYTAVADGLRTSRDVNRTTLLGFCVNAGMLTLASVGALLHFPAILSERAPVTYITQHGGGGALGVVLVSALILLAVVSTGVGLIYGSTRRITAWWSARTGRPASRKVDVAASAVYVVASWCVASYGLIPLIAKGYAWVGAMSAPLIVAPILLVALWRVLRTLRAPEAAPEA